MLSRRLPVVAPSFSPAPAAEAAAAERCPSRHMLPGGRRGAFSPAWVPPFLIAVSATAMVSMTSLAQGFTFGDRVVSTGGWPLLAGAAPACVGVA